MVVRIWANTCLYNARYKFSTLQVALCVGANTATRYNYGDWTYWDQKACSITAEEFWNI